MEPFFLALEKASSLPLYEQVANGFKHELRTGRIPVGAKLPSKRRLGDFLDLSQTTVELAYGQLLAEGYIRSIPRRGYFAEPVEALVAADEPQPLEHLSLAQTDAASSAPAIDFHPGEIDATAFPFAEWRRLSRGLYDAQNAALLLHGDPQGEPELRAEIARYLRSSRGVRAAPEQVFVRSGTEQLLGGILRAIGRDHRAAVEDPGYLLARKLLLAAGLPLIPIPMEADGLDVDALETSSASLLYATPSHQFPTGAVLSAAKRARLLQWAAAAPDRLIIEDDYDSEFRYVGRPIPSLQSLDAGGCVAYIGTFSKSVMPSLRMSYAVLPPALALAVRASQAPTTVPRFDQHLLARFMASGGFARHVNRMRKLYRRKLQALQEALARYAPAVRTFGDQAGMHLVIELADARSEGELVACAAAASIRVRALSDYALRPAESPARPRVILGYSALAEQSIESALDALMHCWDIQSTAARA